MHRLYLLLTTFVLLGITAGPAFAAETGHGLPWMNLFYRILTLGLFIYILYYFFGKKIIGFFKGRSTNIASELSSLEKRKEDAKKQLEEAAIRIASLEKERAAILADYHAQGEALKAGILEQAEKAAAKTIAQAKLTAQNEIDAAIVNMREEMAEAVATATEKLLKEQLSPEEHAALVDKYVTKVVLH